MIVGLARAVLCSVVWGRVDLSRSNSSQYVNHSRLGRNAISCESSFYRYHVRGVVVCVERASANPCYCPYR